MRVDVFDHRPVAGQAKCPFAHHVAMQTTGHATANRGKQR
jgi:hypothetical protein